MKIIKTKNGILFLLLMAGIVINILWSVRLESKAEVLSAKVQEHHTWLSQNKDILIALNEFSRQVAGATGINMLEVSNQGAQLKSGVSVVRVGKGSLGEGVEIGDTNTGTIAVTQKKGVGIITNKKLPIRLLVGKGQDLSLKMDPSKKQIEIKKGESVLRIGKGKLGEGVEFGEVKTGTIAVTKDKGVGIITDKNLPIRLLVGKGDDFYVKLDADKERIEVKKGESVVRVGKGKWGEGVELGEFGAGTIAITKGKGVGIRGKESLKINFDGEIYINAKGNINIRSENGEVSINGKKIHLNE